MKYIWLLIASVIVLPVFAGDLWEVTSMSVAPDGTPMPYTQNLCFPIDGFDLAKIMGGGGDCTFDQKNGNASAMTFSMTCKTAGMSAELASMKVTGDANLSGNNFSMNYVITVGGNQGSVGSDFKMSGKAEAHKVGKCNDR